MLLAVALVLPRLFWDNGPDTAAALREARIGNILVPAARVDAWKGVNGIAAEAADPARAIKLQTPTVNYRIGEAGATRQPWLVSNGWQFLRTPTGRFYYDVTGRSAALAAAEAFSYGADAMIRTDAAGLKPLGEMLEFLRGVPAGAMPPVADIGFIDDGTPAAGEVMNLMVRDNLLFRIVPAPDPKVKINVRLGSKEYPAEEAKNPGAVAHSIRANLTDEKRSVRIYGSVVVVARLTASAEHARVQLLNYAGVERKVNGIRVRVIGQYSKHQVSAADSPGAELLDFTVESGSTEFTLPELKSYAVIDLSR
jgi:hypothetical protein